MSVGGVVVKIRGDTASNLSGYTGPAKEVLADETNWRLRLCDGSTAGGREILTSADYGSQVRAALLSSVDVPGGIWSLMSPFWPLRATGVNLNALGDTTFGVPMPPNWTYYRVQSITALHASAVPASVKVGLYTGAGQTGVELLAPTTPAITTTSANTTGGLVQMSLTEVTAMLTAADLYLNVSTVEGSALTADFQIVIQGY